MANILQYNQALGQYSSGNYAQAQKTASAFGPQVASLFAAPSTGGGGGGSKPQQASAPSGGGGQSAPSAPSIDFDAIYNPIISNLQNLSGTLNANYKQDLGQVDTQHQKLQDQVSAQSAQLNSQNQTNYDSSNQDIQSAYESALKQWQNLYQQYGTGFAGSGYGQQPGSQYNLSDYEKNQLNLQAAQTQSGLFNEDVNNTNNFNNQKTGIGAQVAGWNTQIQQWYSQAYDQLQGQLQSGLAQIQGDLSMAESDKANAQMAFANEWAQQQMALQDYGTQLNNELQVAQQMAGQTGSNAATAMNNMLGTMSSQNSALQQAVQQTPNNLLSMNNFSNINQQLPQMGFVNFNNDQKGPMSGIMGSIGQSQANAAQQAGGLGPYAGTTGFTL